MGWNLKFFTLAWINKLRKGMIPKELATLLCMHLLFSIVATMDGLLAALTLVLGDKCFLDVVLAENVDFSFKYRIQFSWFLVSKKHVFVAWSLKWTVKSVTLAFLFAYRNANKELRSRIFSLPLSCLCLLTKFMR